ncbi:MAG: ABC transporter ATP-binding protein [Blastocatellia bacterium]|nr:ABC transporter ATP-binding protein [Blastocatellia bacterium]
MYKPDVDICSVSKTFDESKVIDNVSLQVEPGEFLTLLGPSGCGKTTLLRLIAGFETPTSGRIFLRGEEVTYVPPYKRNVHTVFQQYALFPHLTVARNVAFGLERRKLSSSEIAFRVRAALELVRLSGFEDRYPAQLSGGQQQRVAIARAIVLEPKVLLLDEPLSALDLKLRREMQIELKNLQRRLGISFIYVTHDQQEALAMSDRIAVMRAGKIVQIGPSAEVYDKPRTPFVADFIGEANILTAKIVDSCNKRLTLEVHGRKMEITTDIHPTEATVKIAIRPEKISLSTQNGCTAIPGLIEERLYLGDSTQWRIRLDEGHIVTVVEQGQTNHRCNKGDRVYLSWNAEATVLLEEDA